MKPVLPILWAVIAAACPAFAQDPGPAAPAPEAATRPADMSSPAESEPALQVSGPAPGAPLAEGPVVVELYTSQGCSSCPPADELLAELAGRRDVIALALHVDYWDYIGWEDTFGAPGNTERQKAYARAAGHRTIYTPQMVIDGVDHLVGYQPMQLAELIDTHRDAADAAAVRLSRQGDRLLVRVAPVAAPVGEAMVQLVRFQPSETVEIERGENAGKTITYVNVVTGWQTVGEWDGQGPDDLSLPLPGPDAAAVIVQRPGAGPILGAAVAR